MKELNVQVAHGWWSQGMPEAILHVNYYAIGSPELSRLVVSVSPEKNCLHQVNCNEEHLQLAEIPAVTIADYAAHWSAQYTGPLSEHTGGGEMLSDEAVMILASNHPDWFMGKDLVHILSVLEERYDDPPDEIWAAREDLRVFVEALLEPFGEWEVDEREEEEVAYAAA